MNITTKYNVGDKYWVARCFKKHISIEKVIDGATWTKDDLVLTPHVKEKKIVGIGIDVKSKGKVSIKYYTTDVEPAPYSIDHTDTYTLASITEEDKMVMLTKTEAETLANEMFEQGKEYYG